MMLAKLAFITRDHSDRLWPCATRSSTPTRKRRTKPLTMMMMGGGTGHGTSVDCLALGERRHPSSMRATNLPADSRPPHAERPILEEEAKVTGIRGRTLRLGPRHRE